MKVLHVAILGFRRLFRDPMGLFFILLLPVLITLLVGLSIFRNLGTSFKIGVFDQGKGSLSTRLQKALDDSRALDIKVFTQRAKLDTAIRREEVFGGVVIPAGYDQTLRSGGKVAVDFISSPRTSSSQAIQATVASILTNQGTAIRAAAFATANAAGDFDQNLSLALKVQDQQIPTVDVESETVGTIASRAFTGFTYPAASNTILFMFITSMTVAGQLIESRQLGITRRMLSTPTGPGVILAGLTLSRFIIACFQGLFILAMGTLLFGVRWGSATGAAMLITSFALVSTGIAMLFGSVLRTREQANLGVPLGIGLGMLGGCMWPLEIVSSTMRTVGHLTPHAWAMDGFIALIGKGVGAQGIMRNVLVLLGFALALLTFSLRRFRKGITQ